MAKHHALTDPHAPWHSSPTDPAADNTLLPFMAPGVVWKDTSTDPATFKERNTANTGWDLLDMGGGGGGGISNPLTTAGDIFMGGVSGTPTRLPKGTDGQILSVDPTTHLLLWIDPPAIPDDIGFDNPMTSVGDLILGGVAGAAGRLAKGADGKFLGVDPTDHNVKWVNAPSGGGGGGDFIAPTYYNRAAALLDPAALEYYRIGHFSYEIPLGETHYLMASWATQIGSTGRMEVRNPATPLPLNGVTINGTDDGTGAVFLDPSLVSYEDAWTTYHNRLELIHTLPTREVVVTADSQHVPLLPGPYGSILLRAVCFDFTWLSIRNLGTGYNLANEESDSSSQREDNPLLLPISKKTCSELAAGVGSGLGSVVYIHCPSDWSTDPQEYDFRDDFFGDALDDSTTWVRAQSTVGNVEIDTQHHWLKVLGDGSWGDNGAYTNYFQARTDNFTLIWDVFINRGVTSPVLVGFSDGGGHSYVNFAHGVFFTSSSGDSGHISIFENGTDRGSALDWVSGRIYRVRITIQDDGAVYEVQGDDAHPIGGPTWFDMTPVTSSSITINLHVGITTASGGSTYASDPRTYIGGL